MIDRDPDASLLSELMGQVGQVGEVGGAGATGANEYDLRIAILRSAVALTLRHAPAAEKPRAEDRRFAISLIGALSRAVGLPPID